MDDEPIIPIPEPDPEIKDKLVEQSCISIWEPKQLKDRIKEHRKGFAVSVTVAAVIVILFILAASLYSQRNTAEDKLAASQKKVSRLTEENRSLQSDLNDANTHIQVCQTAVTTAWDAWERRNEMFVAVLSNIFNSNTGDIEYDNSLAALDIMNGRDCDPTLKKDN